MLYLNYSRFKSSPAYSTKSKINLQIIGTTFLHKLPDNVDGRISLKEMKLHAINQKNNQINYYREQLQFKKDQLRQQQQQQQQQQQKEYIKRQHYCRRNIKKIRKVTTPKEICYQKRLLLPMSVTYLPGSLLAENAANIKLPSFNYQRQQQQPQHQSQQESTVKTAATTTIVVYNDTIKRIQEANEFHKLRQLALKYVKRFLY